MKNNFDILFFGNHNVEIKITRYDLTKLQNSKLKDYVQNIVDKHHRSKEFSYDLVYQVFYYLSKEENNKNTAKKINLGILRNTLLFMLRNSNLAEDGICDNFERWIGQRDDNNIMLGQAVDYNHLRHRSYEYENNLFFKYLVLAHTEKQKLRTGINKYTRDSEAKITINRGGIDDRSKYHDAVAKYLTERFFNHHDNVRAGFFANIKKKFATIVEDYSKKHTHDFTPFEQQERRIIIKENRNQIAKKFYREKMDYYKMIKKESQLIINNPSNKDKARYEREQKEIFEVAKHKASQLAINFCKEKTSLLDSIFAANFFGGNVNTKRENTDLANSTTDNFQYQVEQAPGNVVEFKAGRTQPVLLRWHFLSSGNISLNLANFCRNNGIYNFSINNLNTGNSYSKIEPLNNNYEHHQKISNIDYSYQEETKSNEFTLIPSTSLRQLTKDSSVKLEELTPLQETQSCKEEKTNSREQNSHSHEYQKNTLTQISVGYLSRLFSSKSKQQITISPA